MPTTMTARSPMRAATVALTRLASVGNPLEREVAGEEHGEGDPGGAPKANHRARGNQPEWRRRPGQPKTAERRGEDAGDDKRLAPAHHVGDEPDRHPGDQLGEAVGA